MHNTSPARPRARRNRLQLVGAAAAVLASTAALAAVAPSARAAAPAPQVSGLSLRSGGTWGGDSITISGVGFGGTGRKAVVAVQFGRHRAGWAYAEGDGVVRTESPAVGNARRTVDVRVVLRDGTRSRATAADRFTFVVPTRNTPVNGGWSANQSRAAADSLAGRAARLDAAAVAHNPGHWTPAMGKSALRRAAAWVGMPYAWAGGSYHGPTRGSCSGGGPIARFDCTFRGFDCSGLALYGWGRYLHLDHFAATQRRQAGRFHPTLPELQPGDLLFFSGGGSTVSHVVMYAGGGRIVQAAQSGYPVRYDALADILSWEPRYFGATRPMSRTHQERGNGPVITSVTTAPGPTDGTTALTIHGRHLDTASEVLLGSVGTYDFTLDSATSVTVTVPAAAPGQTRVRIANAWGVSPTVRV